MRKILALGPSLALLMIVSGPVAAQGNADTNQLAEKLGQCLVDNSTGADRIAVAGWMLAAIASAPQLKDVAVVTPAKKEQLDRGMAAVFTRLMTKDCPAQAQALIATQDQSGFEVAGGALGKIAMQELLGNPASQRAIGEYTRYLNRADFSGVM